MKIQKFTFPLFFFPPWFWKISVPPGFRWVQKSLISDEQKVFIRWIMLNITLLLLYEHNLHLCLKFICSCLTCKLWFWFWNVTLTTHFSSFRLIKEHPKIVLPVANNITQRISSFIRNIDFALDWMQLESGKSLYRLVWQRKTI